MSNDNIDEKWSNVNYVMEASIREANAEDYETAKELGFSSSAAECKDKGVLLLYLHKEDENRLGLYKNINSNAFKEYFDEQNINITKSEMEVLRRLVEGKTNKAIAHDLYLSVNTVKTHVRSIFQKLGVNTRSAAVNCAFSSKLIK